MKSQKEILKQIEKREKYDLLGFEVPYLISALNYNNAKEFLKDGVDEEGWENSDDRLKSDEDVIEEMKDYLTFAFRKAKDKRGISANRSISHYLAWSFLVDDELYEWIKNEYKYNHNNYGICILEHIQEWLDER